MNTITPICIRIYILLTQTIPMFRRLHNPISFETSERKHWTTNYDFKSLLSWNILLRNLPLNLSKTYVLFYHTWTEPRTISEHTNWFLPSEVPTSGRVEIVSTGSNFTVPQEAGAIQLQCSLLHTDFNHHRVQNPV